MQDLAESVIENLPPAEPAGYRLVVWMFLEGSAVTILEAKAVSCCGKLAYLVRRPHGKLDGYNPYNIKKHERIPPKRDWDTFMATSPLQLKFILRETLNDNDPDTNAVLFPPFVRSDDRQFGTDVPVSSYSSHDIGGGDGSGWQERVLDEAIAALGILKGPVSGPFSWEK